MIIVNNGRNPLSHGEYKLSQGAQADIPDEIAKIWLEIPGVTRYIEPEDVEKAKAEAKAKIEEEKKALEEENAKLKAEIEKLKAPKEEKAEAKAKK